MAILYPSGDWTGRGAQALDNPRAASGEPSLIKLYRLRSLCHCLIFCSLITLEIMYLLIAFLPLIGSFFAGFFGRFLGSEGSAIMTTTCISFSSILSLIAFHEVAPGASACYLRIAPWILLEMFDASWGFFGNREVIR
ncbi:hypothetical protein VNO80_08434 [Phaseolus coccineus]|uniref:DUF8018 domain-containing protein n=1 Tax=Phaseolus coccineus TaxID=3886 RepID=A0AAN9RG79_PHACN